MTISAYRRFGRSAQTHDDHLAAPMEEVSTALGFCETLLRSPLVECPPAFVLDVGIIEGRGWAVVEWNECWASGIYSACDPQQVLHTLLGSCVVQPSADSQLMAWNFREHYYRARG